MYEPESFLLIGAYEELEGTIMIFQHVVKNPSFSLDSVGHVYHCLMSAGMIDRPSTICVVWSFFTGDQRLLNRITIMTHAEVGAMGRKFSKEQLLQQLNACVGMKRKERSMLVVGYDLEKGFLYTELVPGKGVHLVQPLTSMEEMGQIFCYQSSKTFTRVGAY
jgi:hypothetical protein